MTDQFGSDLTRILRNIELRLQKLETSSRIKPGIDLPPPPTPAADVGGMSGLSTPNSWPGTYTPATGALVQDDLEMIRTWVLAVRTNLRAAGIMS